MYKGVIIEESLKNKAILKAATILNTEVEKVTRAHRTPWLKKWTMHQVGVDDDIIEEFSENISRALDPKHASSWYADLRNASFHYIIFRDRVFKVNRRSKVKNKYALAVTYGTSIGIPKHQLDFV